MKESKEKAAVEAAFFHRSLNSSNTIVNNILAYPSSNATIPEVIRSFADDETRKIYRGVPSKRFPREMQRVARRKLVYLDDAENLRDLFSPPGNQLEKLKGARQGQYSIRINNQWRICFEWIRSQAENVEIVDYHS